MRRVVSRGDMVRLLRWYVPEGDHLYSDSAEAQTPPGSLGVVSFIDDSGTIHCVWESGFSLGLITERGVEDVWQLVR